MARCLRLETGWKEVQGVDDEGALKAGESCCRQARIIVRMAARSGYVPLEVSGIRGYEQLFDLRGERSNVTGFSDVGPMLILN